MNELEAKVQKLETLLNVAKELTSQLDLDKLLDTIMEEVTQVMAAERSSLYLIDEERGELWTKVAQGLDDIIRIPIGKGISGIVAQTGETLCIEDAWEFPGFDRSWDLRNNFRTRSVLCMPVNNREGKRIGVIQVINKREGLFTSDDEDLLAGLTSLIGIAIENAILHKEAIEKQRIEAELELAAEIQRGLLPESPPVLEGYEIAAMSIPARQVGGDYYDFVREDEGHVALIIGDVSGKGIPAAMLMAVAMSGLHAIDAPSPPDKMARLNDLLYESTDSWQYSTLFYASLDLERRMLTTINAGHNPMILADREGRIRFLEKGGMALGMFGSEISEYSAEETQLHPGDLLVMYTDGVTDATNEDDEDFGADRLVELVRGNCRKSAEELKDIIYDEVRKFVGNAPQFDDLTLLILKAL